MKSKLINNVTCKYLAILVYFLTFNTLLSCNTFTIEERKWIIVDQHTNSNFYQEFDKNILFYKGKTITLSRQDEINKFSNQIKLIPNATGVNIQNNSIIISNIDIKNQNIINYIKRIISIIDKEKIMRFSLVEFTGKKYVLLDTFDANIIESNLVYTEYTKCTSVWGENKIFGKQSFLFPL